MPVRRRLRKDPNFEILVGGGTPYPIPFNIGPNAAFTATVSGLTVTVNGSASDDPDGTIASYTWNWGDGTANGTGVSTTHTYATAGTRVILLTVTDNVGAPAS